MMYLGNNPVALSHTLNTGSGDFVDTDTKNTAGATDTSDKIFIVGAKTQEESPQTYTQDTAYIGADGYLYSGGKKVLTSHQDISGKADKTEIPTKVSQLTNDSGYLTSHQDISGKADKTEIPTKVSQLTNDSGYLTSHQDISGKADKTEIPTKVSQLTNDSGYLTSHQDISGKAPINSPAFTGIPTAPTAASGTNTTQVATTAFVKNALDNIPTGSSDIPFGVCTTARNIGTKEVTIEGITSLHDGLRISVRFVDGNRVPGYLPGNTTTIHSSLKLNLNNLGAKPVVTHYDPIASEYIQNSYGAILNTQIIDLIYYNGYWNMVDRVGADSYTPGVVYLDNAITRHGEGPYTVSSNAIYDWVEATESNRVQICSYMEHDQYIGGLSTNEYRCVFRIYFVNSTGKIHYPVSPNDETSFSGLFDHITLNIYGYDSSNNGTLLDSQYIQWSPPSWGELNDGEPVDGAFTGHHAFYEYVYRFSSDLANTYDHIGGVVTISNMQDSHKTACELTMYHPQQDLTFSLTNLTHNTVTIKNIGIVIDNYMDQIWNYLWPSFFNIPADTIQVPQKHLDEIEEGAYTASPFVGYHFYKFDFSVPDAGGYYATDDNSNILTTDQCDYPLMCEMFAAPGDNAIYFTDYASCKKISILPFEDVTT